MNTNVLGLLRLGECGFTHDKGTRGDFCLKHPFEQKISVCSTQKGFRSELSLTSSRLCCRSETPASALAGQTDSPEPVRFGYFPL
jgi:hypothetical protein